MGPVSYGLWQRCEKLNVTIMKQGVALGIRPNVQICRPNRYMRYTSDKFPACYHIRRNCAVHQQAQLPEGCLCRYLPSVRVLQWLSIVAAIFLVLGLLLLYFKTITSPQNDSAVFVLSYGPFLCFLLAFILIVTTLILLVSYLRRDIYEDYSFPLRSVSNDSHPLQGFDLHSLRSYAKHYGATFSHERYLDAERELRADANTHYHTILGWATWFEIAAAILVLIVTGLTLWLGTASRSDEV